MSRTSEELLAVISRVIGALGEVRISVQRESLSELKMLKLLKATHELDTMIAGMIVDAAPSAGSGILCPRCTQPVKVTLS